MNIMQSRNTGVGKGYSEEHEIACIGVDGKLHSCLPWEKVTRCGMKVVRKRLKDQDYIEKFCCYECDY